MKATYTIEVQARDLQTKLIDLLTHAIEDGQVKGRYKHLTIDEASDLISYCEDVIQWDYKKAIKRADRMDTATREMIPISLYNAVENGDR